MRLRRVDLDDVSLTLEDDAVVLIVGPNSSGKSQFLRDVVGLSQSQSHYAAKIVRAIDIDKAGSTTAFSEWFASIAPPYEAHGATYHRSGEVNLQLQTATAWWESHGQLGDLGRLFMYHATTEARLESSQSTRVVNLLGAAGPHPLHALYLSPDVEADLSNVSERAFSTGVTLDRFGGEQIALRVGKVVAAPSDGDKFPTSAYLAELRNLTLLQDEGDGVRSLIGLMLYLLAGSHTILLIDEPEAFLHPPQAEMAGRLLTERTVGSPRQAFISTHSSEVVAAALESERPVTIVRLTRSGIKSKAVALEPAVVRPLVDDTLLRYSNLLDGLFADGVLLCEGDADCRFYHSVIDLSAPSADAIKGKPAEEATNRRRLQLVVTHCGGWPRMKDVMSTMRTLHIPTAAIVDFDALRNRDGIQALVASCGGAWTEEMDRDWQVMNSALSAGAKPLSKIFLREEFEKALENITATHVSEGQLSGIKKLLKTENGWSAAKTSGKAAVANGEPRLACDRLLECLARLGLFVVPLGELESFVPVVAGHGPEWIADVHRQKLHLTATEAISFMAQVEKWFALTD